MASNISAIKCPHCGRSAIEDDYYKIDEKTIICYRCGYYYSKKINDFTTSPIEFIEEEYEGGGVFILVKKDGDKQVTIFDGEIPRESFNEYQKEFLQDDVDQEKSFLTTYKEGIFTIHCGTPSENFHLPFEEYKVKMQEKYKDDFNEYLIPIEE